MRPVEYLTIIDLGTRRGKKTKWLEVRSSRTQRLLGAIRWYGPWRQYTFYPTGETIFNHGCLRVIADRCEAETKLQRAKKAPNALTQTGEAVLR